METIGQALKKAREGRKLTVAEVAKTTKAGILYIEALEADDFEVFPAPIYALGFIKLYAESVGLDPETLAQAYRQRAAAAAKEAGPAGKNRGPAPAKKVNAPEPIAKTSASALPAAAARQAARHLADRGARRSEWMGALLPSALEKIHWPAFKVRCVSLSATRLPVETWKTILAIAGITCLVIFTLVVLGWYISWNKAAAASPAARWLQEPPAPYLAAE